MNVYVKDDVTGIFDLVANTPPWGEHCADAVYELTKNGGAYAIEMKVANTPTFFTGKPLSSTHSMVAGYIPYLFGGCFGGFDSSGACPRTYER